MYYRITELNTRKRRHKSEIMDILYGDDYKDHRRDTAEEAAQLAKELKARGIRTHTARIIEDLSDLDNI